MKPSNTEHGAILRRPQVEALTGLARSSIYDRVRAGTFPKPIPLGGRIVGWLEQDIAAWIAERVAAARATEQ